MANPVSGPFPGNDEPGSNESAPDEYRGFKEVSDSEFAGTFGRKPAGGPSEGSQEGGHVDDEDALRGSARFEETGELDLGDDDVRLPWLEGDDDDDLDERGGNTGQLIALVLMGVVALGLIVGGIWWAQRGRPDETLVADGETIAAPAAPYKTRPANPGGNVVAGTGDTSFAVAEGQTRQVRMGNEAPVPVSTPKPEASASPSASASAAASAAPASGASTDMSGVGVQVGAYSTRDSADKGWARLSKQYAALSGMRYRIVEGRADIGTVYRLQALPGDANTAVRLCETLKGAGLSCQVKR